MKSLKLVTPSRMSWPISSSCAEPRSVDDAVEGVVGDGFVVGFLHPGVEGLAERLAFVLDGEIDERGGAAKGGGNGAGLEIVGAGGAAEGHVQMGVDIDAAGNDEASR